jgi:hypothetical protein
MDQVVAHRPLTMQELFLREGVEYSNRATISHDAKSLWRLKCNTHESRVAYDKKLGWSESERRLIKKLHPTSLCDGACMCNETLRLSEASGKIGVIAKKNLPKGTLLGFCAGDAITTSEAAALGADNPYLFMASELEGEEQILINAQKKGNWTRFIGHSLLPNVEACIASGVNGPQIVVKAIRPIFLDDKILMNYGNSYCEKFDVTEEVLSRPVKEKKRKKEDVSEMGAPLSRRKITRWNDSQFLMTAAYSAIASSEIVAERKAHLTRAINEQRALNGYLKVLTDEEIKEEFIANRLDWELRHQRKALGWS